MAIPLKHVATALLLQVVMLSVLVSAELICEESQFDDALRSQFQKAVPLPVACPSCVTNFFCTFSCSPNPQSHFNNVTFVTHVITFSALAGAELNSSITVRYCSRPEVSNEEVLPHAKRDWWSVLTVALEFIVTIIITKLLIDWDNRRTAALVAQLEKQHKEQSLV